MVDAPSRVRPILIVDDDLDAARAFATLVEHIVGHQVEFAINGYAALDLARRMRPEVVFVDLVMPGISGFELARRLRKELGDEVRIIAVSAYGTEQDREKSAKAGCERHLLKPVAPQVIESLLA